MNIKRPVLLLLVMWLLVQPGAALAQSDRQFDASVHVAAATIRELDTTDVGISGRLGWRPTPSVGFEGELGLYPGGIPDDGPVLTARRLEFLAGMTVGPDLGRLRPFGRARVGVLNMAAAPEPVACILIFPPPLSCTLAGGRSLFVIDLGGGLEWSATSRTFLRLDVGDRITTYPGPSFGRGRRVRDRDFKGHDLRVAVGAGFRF